jgi:4'-phosphopantetheinyl transferase
LKQQLVILYTQIEEVSEKKFHTVLREFGKLFYDKTVRYSQEKDRYLSLAGRLLLREALKTICNKAINFEEEITISANGKPVLSDHSFNISHSENYAVCAISKECNLGVDIEFKDETIDLQLMDYVCTDNERSRLRDSATPLMSFYKIWTRKEAVLKAAGRGLSADPKIFDATEPVVEFEGQNWHVKDFSFPENYHTAIASNRLIESYEFQKLHFPTLVDTLYTELHMAMKKYPD